MLARAGGVLCSGSIVFDTLVHPFAESKWGTTQWMDSIECHVGGNGANTARALAILGTRARLLGAVGTDTQAQFILDELFAAGVDTHCIASIEAPTASTVVLVSPTGDRQFLHRLGASAIVFKELIQFTPQICKEMTHYHLASLFILPQVRRNGAEMLRRAKEAGLTTSLDTNWDADGEWFKALQPCLPYLDLLFMNEDEARMVTGTSDPAEGAARMREEGVGTAVMKLGGNGCAIFNDEVQVHVPAYAVAVKDTTGAGDCFVAGFLAARQKGADWLGSGRLANAVAGLSVQALGAVTGLLPYAQAEAWMRTAVVRPALQFQSGI